MICSICQSQSKHEFTRTVLNRYDCSYFYCSNCGYLQTEEPYWLPEAYSSPIAHADTGILKRNIALSNTVAKLLYLLFDCRGSFVDAAGGYGLFVRLMRDIGFDFYWDDKYTENIHARGFEANFSSGHKYEVITAFEVLEHVVDPVGFIKNELERTHAEALILSTELFQNTPPRPEEWWYYCFETGQHISFYQRRTLEYIAHTLNLHLTSRNSLHILSRKKLDPLRLKLATSSKFDGFVQRSIRKNMTSKTVSDHRHFMSGAGS